MSSSQLELFPQAGSTGESNHKTPGQFLYSLRQHEKIIVVIILFITCGVICFSLGVEKGKNISAEKKNIQPLDSAKSAQLQNVVPKAIVSKIAIPQAIVPANNNLQAAIPPKAGTGIGNYTIQVASYQSRISAEKESAQLTKRGLTSLVLSKGRFSVLYVGRFSDMQSARPVLTELKKQYHDCFIRRI
jgi:cell division protein FtsN